MGNKRIFRTSEQLEKTLQDASFSELSTSSSKGYVFISQIGSSDVIFEPKSDDQQLHLPRYDVIPNLASLL